MKKLLLMSLFILGCSKLFNYNKDTNKNLYKISSISSLKWKNRLIVLKRDSITYNYKEYEEQILDRNILIIQIINDKSYINKIKMSKLFTNSLKSLINNYNSNIFLVGKDGRIKKMYDDYFSFKEIFNDIDSMPMRKKEIIKNGKLNK